MDVRRVDLQCVPREAMARLRRRGRYALLESALPVPGRHAWSYVCGPARATLYTDARGTRLQRHGRDAAIWDSPFDALQALSVSSPCDIDMQGDAPPGLDFVGGWVGVLGYELGHALHKLPPHDAPNDPMPSMWWMGVDHVLAYHHDTRSWWQATLHGPSGPWPCGLDSSPIERDEIVACAAAPAPPSEGWHAGPLSHRMDQRRFECAVRVILEAIARGDVLQVNLTRREEADFEGDAWSLYESLVQAHPAPFSAFLEAPGFSIASVSPERFLRLRGDRIEARPIKGTVARGATHDEDRARRDWLASSEKNRAENLMITDLMRNDIGRVARTGSVEVSELFGLEPYASVWQMVSTVQARLQPGRCAADLLRSCWPPGSMTGAPKRKAMQVIDSLEPHPRGFYAGSIGYLDCRGGMDLSVVIRTAIVAGKRVTLQLGGGIVADSDPLDEWRETQAKGERLRAVLNGAAFPRARR